MPGAIPRPRRCPRRQVCSGATPDQDARYLGKLKQTHGAQTYDLPKGAEQSKYTTLPVWSKQQRRAVASPEGHPSGGGAMEHT